MRVMEGRILATAKELFTRFGFKRVSMDEIASKTGTTKRTVYKYFENKEALFMAVLSIELENLKKIIDENDKKDIPYFEKFQLSLYEFVKYKKTNELLFRIYEDYEMFGYSESKKALKQFDNKVIDYIKSKVTLAIQNKHIKECDVDIVSFVIYKIYAALMYEWDSTKKTLNEKEISEFVTSMLKDGLFIK